MKFFTFLLLLIFVFASTCSIKKTASDPIDVSVISKINFDLNIFDEDGLYGEGTSKRAMDYEFCIPNDENIIQQIKKIDPSVKDYKTTKGRIGCSEKEVLCIGNTHQKNFKAILIELASLDFIKRIDPTYFE